MTDTIVSYETAALAVWKKKFHITTANRYLKVGTTPFLCEYDSLATCYFSPLLNDHIVEYNEIIYAPTQSLLQKWLRDEHQLLVIPLYSYNDYPHWCVHVENILVGEDNVLISGMDFEPALYLTYEEALEKGLQIALNLLK
jgi:hypothetical protein